ncbi:MAG: J domain-containing protein [Candidatus Ancillula sp.]|nr:J domain-containing protein [Candidatus Ancillula sp.]
MKDYYSILGVNKNADEKEIKKAWKKKTRQFHPDLAGDTPENNAKISEINDAFEVLGHADKRSLYDRGIDPLNSNGGGFPGGDPFGGGAFNFNFGGSGDIFSDVFDMFTGGGFSGQGQRRQRSRKQRGDDVLAKHKISLKVSIFGVESDISFNSRLRCDACGGSGSTSNKGEATCPTCQGRGVVEHIKNGLFGQMVQQSPCPTCDGFGTIIQDPCPKCVGKGVINGKDTIKVKIPAGVKNGNRIQVTGRGAAGYNGGDNGTLFVEIQVKPDTVYEVNGDDLICKMAIPFTVALLGGQFAVETLDGEKEITIPQGSSSGQIVEIKGLGLPRRTNDLENRGNLQVFLEVQVPQKLNTKQKKLIEQLATLLKDDKFGSSTKPAVLENVQTGGFFKWVKKLFR